MTIFLCIAITAIICTSGAYFFGAWVGWNAGGKDAMAHPDDWR